MSEKRPTMNIRKTRLPWAMATVAFIGLIGFASYRNREHVHTTTTTSGLQEPRPAVADALARYGFTLTEGAKEAGLVFTHTPPKLDPKLAPILPRVADMGAAIAVGDIDNDGKPDVYVTDSGENAKNRLFRNIGGGKFEEIGEKLGIADVNKDGTGTSMGALFGDFDNDGFEDLLVYKWGRPELFKNEGGKAFTRITEMANLPKWMNANTATLLDYDNDGKLDMLLCGYFAEGIDLWNLKDTKIMPDSLQFAHNGTDRHLLKGDGTGKFVDVTKETGIDTKAWTLAAGVADLNGDRFPEIVLANDYGYAELWVNEGGKRFTNVARQGVVGARPKAGMNISFGDIYNDGRLSIYRTNITESEGNLIQNNDLWLPDKPGSLTYTDEAGSLGIADGGWSFGAQFADLNNDGYQDLYLVNGYISADPKSAYWGDYSRVMGGTNLIIVDTQNWPTVGNKSLAGYEAKRLWINDGTGRFTEVAQAVGASDRYDGRAVAVADLDADGALDILVANQRGPLLLYKNKTTPDHRWVSVSLEGVTSNRSAIGASVTAYFAGQKQTQVVTGGIGFCAQNQRPLHFGLGKTEKLEKLEIRWPSGTIQTLDGASLPPGQIHRVKES
jgi:enediyne biosynthesis protein E4